MILIYLCSYLKTFICIVYIYLYTGDLMAVVVSTRISKELAQNLERIEKIEKTDRATILRKLLAKAIEDWNKEYALSLYRDGKITLWRAARMAKISLREMMELAAERNIHFQYSEKDLKEDLSALRDD